MLASLSVWGDRCGTELELDLSSIEGRRSRIKIIELATVNVLKEEEEKIRRARRGPTRVEKKRKTLFCAESVTSGWREDQKRFYSTFFSVSSLLQSSQESLDIYILKLRLYVNTFFNSPFPKRTENQKETTADSLLQTSELFSFDSQ